MSSGTEAEGFIAAAVVAPLALAAGAGWVAWQTGKALVNANRAIDQQIAAKKAQLRAAAHHRKTAAVAAHQQMTEMCKKILSQLESDAKGMAPDELALIKRELQELCSAALPEDVGRIESMVSRGYLQLERILRRREKLASIPLSDQAVSASVAQRMEQLRIAIGAMEIRETVGKDIRAADPAILERAKINARLAEAVDQVMAALGFVDALATDYGLTAGAETWFHSCFNGIDTLIETLCRPTTSNEELKKGVKRLEESLERYEMMIFGIEKETKEKAALYAIYTEVSEALVEPVEAITAFAGKEALEERLEQLKERAKQAEKCARIYEKLGPSAYLCYAWEQELRKMGYQVHEREAIVEMLRKQPTHAKKGAQALPCYSWEEDELMQLLSITDGCDLQLIVHKDGSVSMQTIADAANQQTVDAQKAHCSGLSELHERLRKNWFILYGYKETDSPESITTHAQWRGTIGDTDGRSDEMITDQRKTAETPKKTRQSQ